MKPKIRKVKKNDYEPVIKLFNGFVNQNRYSKHNNNSFYKVIQQPNNYVFVLELNKQLIGFVTFSTRWVIRYPKQIAEIDELFVLPDYRQKGYGKMLIQHVIDQAKKQNCYRIFIESHYDHKPAHRMYESMGFTNYGYHFIQDL